MIFKAVSSQELFLCNTVIFSASGQKLLSGRRQGNLQIGKSQTLPRNMGSRSQPNIAAAVNNRPSKPTSTPPAVKRQLSVSCFILNFASLLKVLKICLICLQYCNNS